MSLRERALVEAVGNLQTLPLAPCLLLGITILDEMASPVLLLGLTIEDIAKAQDVPQAPEERIDKEEGAHHASIWCQCCQTKHVKRNEDYRDVDGAMKVHVLWTNDIVHWSRLLDRIDRRFSVINVGLA